MSAKLKPTPPTAFISYAWTNEAYSNRVIALAERLASDGVVVRFDKWDLQPGHDANAFMESMVTDDAVTKVLLVSNKIYAEKANSRAGGVGTEAQIVSPQIYKKADQDKFALVAFEIDSEGKPFVPAFYGARIYINLSIEQGYEEEYDRLLRWIFDKPLHRRPPLGTPPGHIVQDSSRLARADFTSTQAIRAVTVPEPQSNAILKTFVDQSLVDLSSHRLVSNGKNDFDDEVVESIKLLRPLIVQAEGLVRGIARASDGLKYIDEVVSLLEGAQALTSRPAEINQWHEWDFDNFRFFAYELFISVIATLLKERRFDLAKALFEKRYFSENSQHHSEFTYDFSRFCHRVAALGHRNQRLNLNRASLHADLLKERATSTPVSMEDLIAADLAGC